MSERPEPVHFAGMPIFTKTIDFLEWLVPRTNDFPRLHRHTVTRRLLDSALDLLDRLLESNSLRREERLERLHRADGSLDRVRHYLRLVRGLRWLTPGQYQHASRAIAEIGRLLGGWIKTTQAQLEIEATS